MNLICFMCSACKSDGYYISKVAIYVRVIIALINAAI